MIPEHVEDEGKNEREGNVWVLAQRVGLAVVQRVAVVPPLGRGALPEGDDDKMHPVPDDQGLL